MIDAAQAELPRSGWSAGDMAMATPSGVVWMVYAHRGEQRIVGKARGEATAWREAVKVARR